MIKTDTNQTQDNQEPVEAPTAAVTLDLAHPLAEAVEANGADYTGLSIYQAPGAVRCVVAVDEADLPELEKLTEDEQRDLQRCEGVIRATKESFYQFALALEEIKRRKLYRDRFTSFPEYCEAVHGLGQSYAYRQAAFGKLLRENSPMGEKRPANERQARALMAETKERKAKPAQPEVVEPAPASLVEAPEVAITEEVPEPSVAPVLPFPSAAESHLTPFAELQVLATKAYNIYCDSTRRKELEQLLFKLKRDLGEWAKWQEQPQPEAA